MRERETSRRLSVFYVSNWVVPLAKGKNMKNRRAYGVTWWVQTGIQGTKVSLGSKIRMPKGRKINWGFDEGRDDQEKYIDQEESGTHDGVLWSIKFNRQASKIHKKELEVKGEQEECGFIEANVKVLRKKWWKSQNKWCWEIQIRCLKTIPWV